MRVRELRRSDYNDSGRTSVEGKDLLGDDGGDGEAVEDVDERLPDFDVAPSLALVVEAVYFVSIVDGKGQLPFDREGEWQRERPGWVGDARRSTGKRKAHLGSHSHTRGSL